MEVRASVQGKVKYSGLAQISDTVSCHSQMCGVSTAQSERGEGGRSSSTLSLSENVSLTRQFSLVYEIL